MNYKKQKSEIKKIVTIGGGTGSFAVLSGLKEYKNLDLTAVVAMTDDGGSTGILRDEYGVLPPGDIRQCLVALSEADKLMRDLFNFRFDSGSLKSHTFGNIFISTIEQMTGDFNDALNVISKILKVRGRVLPVTLDKVRLIAELENGKRLAGERELSSCNFVSRFGIKKIYLNKKVKASVMVIKALDEADMIIIGPGNFYSSLIPNLVVPGVSPAIVNSKAKKVFICNLMNKFGQTDRFTANNFLSELQRFIGKDIIDIIVFNNKHPSPSLLKRYADEGRPIDFGVPGNHKAKLIQSDLLSGDIYHQSKGDILKRTLIRHDPHKLAKILLKILTNV